MLGQGFTGHIEEIFYKKGTGHSQAGEISGPNPNFQEMSSVQITNDSVISHSGADL